MTRTNDTDPADGGGIIPAVPTRATDRPLPHRWTCPFCDRSRVTSGDSESTERSAVADRAASALRAHVIAVAGNGHGPANASPADFDTESVGDYVEFLGD